MALLDDLDKRRGQVEETKENSARLAQAYGSVVTAGLGTAVFPDVIDFNLAFIERPFVSHSCVVDTEMLADALDLADNDPLIFPVVTGYVTEWKQDDRDMYIGAWVGVRVNFPAEDLVDPSISVEIEHHFTFNAIAMKTVPTNLSDATEN